MAVLNLWMFVSVRRFSGGRLSSAMRRLGHRLTTVISKSFAPARGDARDIHPRGPSPEYTEIHAVEPDRGDLVDRRPSLSSSRVSAAWQRGEIELLPVNRRPGIMPDAILRTLGPIDERVERHPVRPTPSRIERKLPTDRRVPPAVVTAGSFEATLPADVGRDGLAKNRRRRTRAA